MKTFPNKTLKIVFNLKDYPLEAVYGTAYVFLDRAYLFLKSRPNQKIEVSLRAKKKLSARGLEGLKGEFLNELLNYTVRINLAKRNHKIREFIVGQALLSAVEGGIAEEESENIKPEDDPLGIAMPWEEKYGGKKEKKRKTRNKKRQKSK